MKRFLTLLTCIILSVLSVHANDKKIKESFYKKGYSEVFTIDDNGIYASKVFNFPDASAEQLRNRVAKYFNNRIERRLSDANSNSQNSSFLDNTLIVSESTPPIKINFMFYTYARYTYRIEIKENKIRATIFLNSWFWGNNFSYLSPFELYPFKSGGGFEKAFKGFYEYVKSIWESLPEDLYKDNMPKLDDNW